MSNSGIGGSGNGNGIHPENPDFPIDSTIYLTEIFTRGDIAIVQRTPMIETVDLDAESVRAERAELEFDYSKPRLFGANMTVEIAMTNGAVQIERANVSIPARTLGEAFDVYPKIFAEFRTNVFKRHGLDENGKRPHPEMLPPNRAERRARRH